MNTSLAIAKCVVCNIYCVTMLQHGGVYLSPRNQLEKALATALWDGVLVFRGQRLLSSFANRECGGVNALPTDSYGYAPIFWSRIVGRYRAVLIVLILIKFVTWVAATDSHACKKPGASGFIHCVVNLTPICSLAASLGIS